jgi:hypothetical protein
MQQVASTGADGFLRAQPFVLSVPAEFSKMVFSILRHARRWPLFKKHGKVQTLCIPWSFRPETLLQQSFGAATEFAKVFICTSSKQNDLLETQNSGVLGLLKNLYGCVKIR